MECLRMVGIDLENVAVARLRGDKIATFVERQALREKLGELGRILRGSFGSESQHQSVGAIEGARVAPNKFLEALHVASSLLVSGRERKGITTEVQRAQRRKGKVRSGNRVGVGAVPFWELAACGILTRR